MTAKLEKEGRKQEALALYKEAAKIALRHVQAHPLDKQRIQPLVKDIMEQTRQLERGAVAEPAAELKPEPAAPAAAVPTT